MDGDPTPSSVKKSRVPPTSANGMGDPSAGADAEVGLDEAVRVDLGGREGAGGAADAEHDGGS